MTKRQKVHLNDKTAKYIAMAQTKRQHKYLNLQGDFHTLLPTEMVFSDMETRRADIMYMNNESMIFNLEEESNEITYETKEKYVNYIRYIGYQYSSNIYLGVLCHKDPGKEFEYHQHSPSLIIKINYFYFPDDELWEKYENIINKVEQNKKLSDNEAMDMAFIAKFISKEHAPAILESFANIYNDAIIEDEKLKMDVGAILGGMIVKHIPDFKKQTKLLGEIEMVHIMSEMEKLVYDEYGDILHQKDKEINEKNNEINKKDKEINKKDKEINKKDKEINEKNNEIKKYKTLINKLKETGDENSTQAKKIIKTLMEI